MEAQVPDEIPPHPTAHGPGSGKSVPGARVLGPAGLGLWVEEGTKNPRMECSLPFLL